MNMENLQRVIDSAQTERGKRVLVECFCGSLRWTYAFVAAKSKSCGCLTPFLATLRKVTHGHCCKEFPDHASRTYRTWRSMVGRCNDQRFRNYPDYGGRGITVCDQWLCFEDFVADMGHAPDGLSLGRIDNNGHYEPGNCEWQTDLKQNNNRRNSRVIEICGYRQTAAQWYALAGLPSSTFHNRIFRGKTGSDLLLPPRRLLR